MPLRGGSTPNGKYHLKFPFWLSAHLPNPDRSIFCCKRLLKFYLILFASTFATRPFQALTTWQKWVNFFSVNERLRYIFFYVNVCLSLMGIKRNPWPITRKSGHICASLTCITWISCITCITCTTEISHQLISWDVIDIAGILVPQNISPTIFVRYHWLSLIIISYHSLSLIIIDYHWLSLFINH